MRLGDPVDRSIPNERSLVRLGDPASALRSPTLAELGLTVTICIAAQSRDGCFVAVADRLLSLSTPDEYLPGIENATVDIGWGWFALGAGDMGVAKSIVLHARQILSKAEPHTGRATRPEIWRAFKGGYRRIWRERVYDEVLGPYNLSWRRFHSEQLDKRLQTKIGKRIDGYRLGVGLLVFGTDVNHFQHLLHVHDPGVIEDRIYVGHWAIGSGANAALGALAVRLTERLPHDQLVYRLCEAKFSCEGVEGIGRMTNVLVTDQNGHLWQFQQTYIDQLRAIWERERRVAPPPDAMEVVREALRYAHTA